MSYFNIVLPECVKRLSSDLNSENSMKQDREFMKVHAHVLCWSFYVALGMGSLTLMNHEPGSMKHNETVWRL
jgi:hypothetical protein